jgi:S-DNA-T family DNA segregation ATPase FtsK/SpoIIIE
MKFCVGVNVRTHGKYYIDFNVQSNLLIGGCPGSGKSAFMDLLIYQALKCQHNVIIGDFKGLDVQEYESKCKVVYTHEELINALIFLQAELKRRVKIFRSAKVKNITQYNRKTGTNMKRWFLFIDELGEATEIIDATIKPNEKKEMEKTIDGLMKSLARLGRALGINLIFGTQRPDVGILQGQTRSQFIYRVCFLADRYTSQIVLDDVIATTINENYKGRCYIRRNISFDEVQVYYLPEKLIRTLEDKIIDFKQNSKKIAAKKKNIEVVEYDWDE